MTAPADPATDDLPCHGCGYDLRVHPPDGTCPECGASVAEARRIAAFPVRPAWRDSDPRWRRRILAGVWVLVLLPLMEVLRASGLASHIPVPAFFDLRNAVRTLDDSLIYYGGVYMPLVFCTGVVLLFAKERGRRRGRLDWTRRWGVVCCYVVFLLSAVQVLFLAALVAVGVAAVFQSMPPKYQPEMTRLLVNLGSGYLRNGPHPGNAAALATVAFSSIAVLLSCIPLYDALRSTGPKRLAAVVLTPLALFSLILLAQVARYSLVSNPNAASPDVFYYGWYFWPQLVVNHVTDRPTGLFGPGPGLSAVLVEVAKWCIVLAIAGWLTVARFATRRRNVNTSVPEAASMST